MNGIQMSTAKWWWLPSASFAVCGLSFLITAIWVRPSVFLPLGVAWFGSYLLEEVAVAVKLLH